MNVNVSSSKEREPKPPNSLLILKKDKAETRSAVSQCSATQEQERVVG